MQSQAMQRVFVELPDDIVSSSAVVAMKMMMS